MGDLIGTIKIMNTRVYSGCGHAAAKEFPDHCPRCRIRELQAEVARYQRSAKRTEEVFAVMKQDLSQSREETRSLHTRLEAAEAKLKEGAVSDLMNEFNGLANMVNELWGDKAPSMREVIVRAKAMLEASGFNKTHKEGAL